MTTGIFITLEGGEGTGKSTQAARLAKKLRGAGHEVVQTREPGGSPAGEAIRALLLGGDLGPISPMTEALLFSAARAEHLQKTIIPALEKGHWVISDRFSDSTRAYQGLKDGLASQTIDDLENIVIGDHIPDFTILLDMPAEDGLARAKARHAGKGPVDRFEARDLPFHQALRDRFLEIAENGRRRIEIVDASKDEETVAAAIWQAVTDRLID